jgi:mRNA interferase MazF
MKRGEVRWYKFRQPDKKRPALIVSRDSVLPYLGELTIAPITSRIRDIPSEVLVGRAEGVPRDSAINCDHLQTVPKAKVGALITTLSPEKMDEVSQAIKFALDLS